MMNDIQFNAVNTRIRTYESQLIERPMLERMLASGQADDVFRILQETVYGDFIDDTTPAQSFESVLLAELNQVYTNLYAITPDKSVVDLFALKYDYQNLKVLTKANYTHEDFSTMLVPLGTMPLTDLKNLVKTGISSHLDPLMVTCVQEVKSFIEQYHEIQSIDIIFDNYYWQHLKKISVQTQDVEMIKLTSQMIDLFNITTALRCHLMGRKSGFIDAVLADGGNLPRCEILKMINQSIDDFINYLQATPYQKLINQSYQEILATKTLVDFDRQKDNWLMTFFKEHKITPFGPFAILGYLYAKEIESKNLRIILVGKINQIPNEILRGRVRDSYV